uniref:Uncharacterized protein n=1 Tax=Setaria viridis TaxID=4556 RepID=A0A4U6SUH3_SETVI|nr:hypothetical protein SEVIR_9G126550v2 [Setaria viridis]
MVTSAVLLLTISISIYYPQIPSSPNRLQEFSGVHFL